MRRFFQDMLKLLWIPALIAVFVVGLCFVLFKFVQRDMVGRLGTIERPVARVTYFPPREPKEIFDGAIIISSGYRGGPVEFQAEDGSLKSS